MYGTKKRASVYESITVRYAVEAYAVEMSQKSGSFY